MAHTYAHLPPNTAHGCARFTLVCAHASNHGSEVNQPSDGWERAANILHTVVKRGSGAKRVRTPSPLPDGLREKLSEPRTSANALIPPIVHDATW